jgi:pimeloyl-ACP methyl ester carboxylesterase
MPRVDANGLGFHVQLLGSGPPLGMLHGLLVGSLAAWYFGAAGKLAERHRVLLYDARGHGLSARPTTGYDLATMTGDLAALLPLCGTGPAVLVGHSYGALTALAFALAHPERVARLLLVEVPLPPLRLPELDVFLAQPREAHLPPSARQGRPRGRLLEQLRFLAEDTSLLADLAREPALDEAALGRLDRPVSLLYGETSSCRPAGERLAALVPGARLELVPGGHFLPTEAPARVTAWILEELHG